MSSRKFLNLIWLLVVPAVAWGRSSEVRAITPLRSDHGPSTAVETVLRQMTQSAGVIFVGEVTAVRRARGFTALPESAGEGVVSVEFHVDQALRGCISGSGYTLHEWAGLWIDGDRYHVGQRLFLFLHRPDRQGLSSPVGGKAGVVPLRGGGQAPDPYDPGDTASEWLADLRWVQARALRPVQSRPEDDLRPVFSGRPAVRVWGDPDQPQVARGELLPCPYQPHDPRPKWMPFPPFHEPATQSLTQLLAMCREWITVSDGPL